MRRAFAALGAVVLAVVAAGCSSERPAPAPTTAATYTTFRALGKIVMTGDDVEPGAADGACVVDDRSDIAWGAPVSIYPDGRKDLPTVHAKLDIGIYDPDDPSDTSTCIFMVDARVPAGASDYAVTVGGGLVGVFSAATTERGFIVTNPNGAPVVS